MAAAPKVFQMIRRNWCTAEIDLFASRACHQLHIYVLETRSSQSGKICSLTEMKITGTSLCFSPFVTDRISSLKSQERGINNDFDNSKLACTILVQSNSRPVHNRASTPAPIFNNLVLNMTLKLIRKHLVEKGISYTAANLISNFRRSGTTAIQNKYEHSTIDSHMNAISA